MPTITGSYVTKSDFILCKRISWSSYISNKYDISPRTYFLETCLTVLFFKIKMRCIPNLYVAWIRSEATLALPDIVYDCHHQVAYVSCIVAYVRLSELTARERATPGERIRFCI
jgi:hypothetical protein